jgi:uncharacterized protein
MTALIRAAKGGRTEIANSLIAAGALLDVKDEYQSTALIWAARGGHSEIAVSLIAAGASLDV